MSKNRYAQLLEIIDRHKPRTIVEVGTWNGDRAVEMAERALTHMPEVFYWGFDLFDEATAETDARELNVKPHWGLEEVTKKLEAVKARHEGFNFSLVRGDTRLTLKAMEDSASVDLAFIDGGHSVETVANDYAALKDAAVVVLDDYYTPDGQGRCPDFTKFGCNRLVDEVGDYVLLPVIDTMPAGGLVQMAVIGQGKVGKQSLKIKTMNCVSEPKIKGNIRYSTTVNPDRWVPACWPHERKAVIVGSGPSMESSLDKLREHKDKGDLLFCVKSAHHRLIEHGIIPYGCIVLDPRIDVLKWIDPPHPEITYFVASMVIPAVWEHLMDKRAKVWGYHALVGADEMSVLKEFDKRADKQSFLVSGGSTAAVRGISLLHAMGFRNFHLYGMDSCYFEQPDLSEMTKMGRPRYFQVEVAGKKFWTEAQMVAQSQDFQMVLRGQQDLQIQVHGDGLIAHLLSKLAGPTRTEFATLLADGRPDNPS